jgi:hypothetical protein
MSQLTTSWMRIAACCVLACAIGVGTSVAVASVETAKHGDDDGTTTGDTTTDGTTTEDSTTDRTSTDRTTTDRTTTDRTTTAPSPGPARAPRIDDIEADWRGNGKVRLRTELIARGAKVTKVRFRYRGRGFTARKVGDHEWARTVTARGGDSRGSTIVFRVRACAGERCNARTGSDEAGG